MSRTSITVVAVVVLCAAGFAYSQGWFNWSSPGAEMESNEVSTSQSLVEGQASEDVAQVAENTTEPTGQAAE